MAERRPAKTGTQRPAKGTTGKASKGFTDEERVAMRERAQELKAAARRGSRAGIHALDGGRQGLELSADHHGGHRAHILGQLPRLHLVAGHEPEFAHAARPAHLLEKGTVERGDGPGRRSRVCTAFNRSAVPSPGLRSSPGFPIHRRDKAAANRPISSVSSTAPAACSTWAAAKCGGCGKFGTVTSRGLSTPASKLLCPSRTIRRSLIRSLKCGLT